MIRSKTKIINGNRTSDLRDGALVVKNGDVELFIVMDGCSGKSMSGIFVDLMQRNMKAKFLQLSPEQILPTNLKPSIIKILEASRLNVKMECIPSAMSIAIMAVIASRVSVIMYRGDAAIGRVRRDGSIRWITRPDIAGKPNIDECIGCSGRNAVRKLIKFNRPVELTEIIVSPFNTLNKFVMATDGWWDNSYSESGLEKDDSTVIHIERV
jgi:serine/threonine protein phosphatase PrpC